MFDLVGASASRPFAKWFPLALALFAASVVAYFECSLPLTRSLSWPELIGSTAERLIAVLLASGATAWVLWAVQPSAGRISKRSFVLRTSLDALWIVPLTLFLREKSAMAMGMAVALVIGVTRGARALQDGSAEPDPEESLIAERNLSFSLPEAPHWFRRQIFAVIVVLCAEIGLLRGFAGYLFSAAVLLGISSAIWTWSLTRNRLRDDAQSSLQSKSTSRILLIAALTIVFTAGGLMPYLRKEYFFGGFGALIHHRHSYHHFAQGEPLGQISDETVSEAASAAALNEYPGVVMISEKKRFTKLIAPAPPSFGLTTGIATDTPLVVPFDGVYWFFKAPDVHPPKRSHKVNGSPDMIGVRSTDHRPLSVEARQNLGSMIDLSCCSRIQIAIRNTDRYPETVSLELVLVNTTLPERPSQSLGRIMVKSTPPWKLYGKLSAIAETLNFPIPRNSSLRSFDEVQVVFHLDPLRADTGPKIAIDHFALVPRAW
jgi:hypothetical protein